MKLRKQDIILSHVTGYGQTGPYKNIPGFGTPATAFSGMTYITDTQTGLRSARLFRLQIILQGYIQLWVL